MNTPSIRGCEVCRKAFLHSWRKTCSQACETKLRAQNQAKLADLLRGKKRPAEVIERVRRANIGKKRTPEQNAANSARQIGKPTPHLQTPEIIAKRTAARIRNAIPRTPEWRKHQSEIMKTKVWTPEVVEKRSAPLRGRPQKHELTKKGVTNQMAKWHDLRSPEGKAYHFKNVCEFVRTHPEMFDPKDLIEKEYVRNKRLLSKGWPCNAVKRLSGVSRGSELTWKGWVCVHGM